MKKSVTTRILLGSLILVLCLYAAGEINSIAALLTGTYTPASVVDQNPATPLSNPTPAGFAPRYLSGFGQDDSFTIFFEDRNIGGQISFIQTNSGVSGFPAAPTATNITDTHFVVKNWPYPDTGPVQYQYRGWGAVGNNANHNFYGSNDLVNWTLISTFTIPNDPGFTTARGFVYYGFHDVIRIPQSAGPDPYHYYAWGESNQGQTQLVYSTDGGSNWTAISSVGGTNPADGPLLYPEAATPSGSFFDLGYDRGWGKIQMRGNDSGVYLAVNTAAMSSLSPAAFEAAFINPANWTWHDDSTGLMSTPLLTATAEHDWREAWLVPNSNPNDSWEVIYNADFGQADGGHSLGHFLINPLSPPPTPTFTPTLTFTPTPIFTSTATPTPTFTPTPTPDPNPNPNAEPGSLPATGFARGTVRKVLTETGALSSSDLTLMIPSLAVEMPIVGIPLENGNWDVSWLGNSAGYLYGTAFPTWQGNTALTGHVWGADNQPGPFYQLKTLHFGDQIQIRAWGMIYTYEVRENQIALPHRVSTVLQHEEYDWLTLLTCEFYNPFSGNYVFRRVVRAVLVDISPQ